MILLICFFVGLHTHIKEKVGALLSFSLLISCYKKLRQLKIEVMLENILNHIILIWAWLAPRCPDIRIARPVRLRLDPVRLHPVPRAHFTPSLRPLVAPDPLLSLCVSARAALRSRDEQLRTSTPLARPDHNPPSASPPVRRAPCLLVPGCTI